MGMATVDEPVRLVNLRMCLTVNHVFDGQTPNMVPGSALPALLHKGRIVFIGDTLGATNAKRRGSGTLPKKG